MHERLETDRLVLRMFGNEDLDAYYAICSDVEVMEFIGQGKAMTRLDTWRQIAVMLGHWQLRGYGSWAIEEKESGKLVGRVGFINPEGWPGLEIGWALARSSWGSGYATEAARAALQYGFQTFGFSRVISLIHPENTRSIRVSERLGGAEDGETELLGMRVLIYAYSGVR
jgi:RimJ/RimL family protein N-acetyltransferase